MPAPALEAIDGALHALETAGLTARKAAEMVRTLVAYAASYAMLELTCAAASSTQAEQIVNLTRIRRLSGERSIWLNPYADLSIPALTFRQRVRNISPAGSFQAWATPVGPVPAGTFPAHKWVVTTESSRELISLSVRYCSLQTLAVARIAS